MTTDGKFESIEDFSKNATMFQSTTKEKPPLKFVVGKHAFTKRSVMMTEDHWHRLQKLYDMYPIINKHHVFQALLEDALSRLGV